MKRGTGAVHRMLRWRSDSSSPVLAAGAGERTSNWCDHQNMDPLVRFRIEIRRGHPPARRISIITPEARQKRSAIPAHGPQKPDALAPTDDDALLPPCGCGGSGGEAISAAQLADRYARRRAARRRVSCRFVHRAAGFSGRRDGDHLGAQPRRRQEVPHIRAGDELRLERFWIALGKRERA